MSITVSFVCRSRRSMLNFDPQTLVALAIILFIAFPVHEFAHAWTANYFGDDTPRFNGRLTLNPLAHLDIVGSLALILTQRFGWAKPVPINPYALGRRSPAAVMWVSLAGPLSNLIMAILAAIPFRLGLVSTTIIPNTANYWAASILYYIVLINLGLMLFNLIPIPPLDGAKVAEYFFPPSWSRVLNNIGPYAPLVLLAIVFIGPSFGINILGTIMGPPLQALLKLLIG